MATKTSLQILGLDGLDDNVVGSTTDGAQKNSFNPRPKQIAMVAALDSDEDAKPDLRRGGRPGKRTIITVDILAYSDGYHGRGSFRQLPIIPEPFPFGSGFGSSSVTEPSGSSSAIA